MLIKVRHAQSTLEYALLISVVVGGLLTMQNYLKRSIQGNLVEIASNISPDPYSPGLTEKKEHSSSRIDKIVESSIAGYGGKTTTEVIGAAQVSSVDMAIKGLGLENWPAQRK